MVGDIPTVPQIPAVRRTAPPSGSTRHDWRDAHWEQLGNGGYLHSLSRPLANEALADESTQNLPSTARPQPATRGPSYSPELEGGPLGPGAWAKVQEITGLGMLRPRVRAEVPYRLATQMWRRLVVFLLLGAVAVIAATMLAQASVSAGNHQSGGPSPCGPGASHSSPSC